LRAPRIERSRTTERHRRFFRPSLSSGCWCWRGAPRGIPRHRQRAGRRRREPVRPDR